MNAFLPFDITRRLDKAETFFWFLDRLSSMNFAVMAEGHGPLDEEILTSVLAKVQSRHWLLSAAIVIDEEFRLRFAACPDKPIALRSVHCSSPTAWRDVLAEWIVEPFALGEAPLVRACHIDVGSGRWVLALKFHHSIADARSGFSLLYEVLLAADGQALADQPMMPNSSLIELFPARLSGEDGQRLKDELKALRKETFSRLGRPESLPGYAQGSAGMHPGTLSFSLSPTQTDTLLALAKKMGTTVTGLIGAAQLIALRRLFEDSSERLLGLTCPADLRPHLREPVGFQTPGFYIALITSSHKVGDSDQIGLVAREISQSLQKQIETGEAHLIYEFLPPADQFPANESGIEAFSSLMAKSPQTSILSNAGRLPPLPSMTKLRPDAMSFTLFPTQTQPIFTAVTTHGAGLTVNINFNRQQLPTHLAETVAQSMRSLLTDVVE